MAISLGVAAAPALAIAQVANSPAAVVGNGIGASGDYTQPMLWPQPIPSSSLPIVADITASGTYDTNAARGSPALARAEGLKTDDFYFTPNADLAVVHSSGRTAFSFDGSLGYDFYARNSVLDRERINADANAQTSFGGCAAGVTGNVFRHQTNFEDVPLQLTNDVQTVGSVGVQATCPKPIGFAPVLSFQQSWGGYSSASLSPSDFQAYTVMGGLSYTHPTLGSLSLYGEYRHDDYIHRRLTPGGPTDGFDNYSGGVRYDRNIGARLQGSAHIGYTKLTPFIAGSPGFAGLTYGGKLTYLVTPKLTAHLEFDRDVLPSVLPNAIFEVHREWSGKLDYALNRRFSINAGAADLNRSYPATIIIGGPSEVFNDDTLDEFIQIQAALGRRFSVALTGTHEHRDASDAAFSYSSNRVTLMLKAQY